LGRSRSRRATPDLQPSSPETGRPSALSLASATLPRVWQGIGYRPLPDAAAARPLFDFAAVSWPPAPDIELAWGAFTAGARGETLVGALVGERSRTDALLHGPVVRTDSAAPDDPLEVAAQLVGATLDHATALGVITLFARPGGLDRVWVRFGFVPVPEVTLPGPLSGRPGVGFYAWRGGSALWTLREARPNNSSGGPEMAPTPPALGSGPATPDRSSMPH
jgi:hypothetical protein